jgi:hypothetical protein
MLRVRWLDRNRNRLLIWWAIFFALGLARTVGTNDFGPVLFLGVAALSAVMSLAMVGLYSLRTAGLSVGGVLAGLIAGAVVGIAVLNVLPREAVSEGSLSVIVLLASVVGGSAVGAVVGKRLREGQTAS